MSNPRKRAMTSPEKILARACGLESTRPGDILYPDPELVVVHDGAVEMAWQELSAIGYGSIKNPERVMFVTDHEVAYTSQRAVERSRNIRRIADDWKVGQFYDTGRGGHGHLFPIEAGMIRPGMFLFSYDMHCTNYGAVGALCPMVGTEISTVLATGSLWVKVPSSILVRLSGKLQAGVHARDVGFVLAGGFSTNRWGVSHDDRLIEFSGNATKEMDLPTRVALCNSITEVGVNNVYFSPPAALMENCPYPDFTGDVGAEYEGVIDFDLSTIVPQVALPGGPDRNADISTVVGRHIDHAFIGACGSGMYEDFVLAAQAIEGREVARGVRLFVVPGTVETAQRMSNSGLTQTFLRAGALMLPPGCGPCAGGAMAPLGSGEVSIATAATNHAGRFGANDAEIYLASPLTVAASAVAGCIVDPRTAN